MRPRILFLDAYDSFTNNIVSQLTTLLDADVHILPIDSPLLPSPPSSSPDDALLARELSNYHAVVCGPGPGTPANPSDVGLIGRVWAAPHDVPVLGVCLGFQSLALAFGGRVRRVPGGGLHGMIRAVRHGGRGLFAGVPDGFGATLYHSLCVELPGASAGEGEGEAVLEELAWVDDERDGRAQRLCMALRHRTRPFWGVQYHPESVCTETAGDRVILNWFREAMGWNERVGRVVGDGKGLVARQARRESLLSLVCGPADEGGYAAGTGFRHTTVPLPRGVDVPDLVELLDDGRREGHVVLDSSNAHLPPPEEGAGDVRGRYSVFALGQEDWVHVRYHAGDGHVEVSVPGVAAGVQDERIPLERYGGSIWGFLADFQHRRRVERPPPDLETPFMGGFMGFVTYEQGLHDIGVENPKPRGHHRPDVCLVWVTKSVVVDHRKGLVHVQQLHHSDETWTEKTAQKVLNPPSTWHPRDKAADATCGKPEGMAGSEYARHAVHGWTLPDQQDYQDKVKQCQEHIAAGDSYELCLTDQTRILRQRGSSDEHDLTDSGNTHPDKDFTHPDKDATQAPTPWQLFKRMRARQPAPFASYLDLGGATVVSASPERFLQHDGAGHCSMRPMKGTVRKSGAVSTLAQAERILHVPKEEAENLMIVDLVRHDLHGVCGAGNVAVRDLMKVEEYRDVYQMITVVEGWLPEGGRGRDGRYTGLDVLAASLPPGSMTGAPKKRSCEILAAIEAGLERSLYSGVVGYMCASGRGDWSVTIRALFRWEDECGPGTDGAGPEGEAPGERTEVWRIGAGGAVTALSTPLGEAEEMFTKLDGPFRTVNWDRLGWTGHGWE